MEITAFKCEVCDHVHSKAEAIRVCVHCRGSYCTYCPRWAMLGDDGFCVVCQDRFKDSIRGLPLEIKKGLVEREGSRWEEATSWLTHRFRRS